jgi:hypothetical protein
MEMEVGFMPTIFDQPEQSAGSEPTSFARFSIYWTHLFPYLKLSREDEISQVPKMIKGATQALKNILRKSIRSGRFIGTIIFSQKKSTLKDVF